MALMFFLFNLYYVDQPYANVQSHGIFSTQLRFGPDGGILGFVHVGIWDRFGLGLSYGAANLIGAGDPEFYEQPGAQIRILAIEEGLIAPTVIVGFDNQGFGYFDDATRRYQIMSKGLYCQVGKAFGSYSVNFVPSLGVNYSFEQDGRWDMFVGLSTVFGSVSALLVEYSPNFSDPLDQDHGYLNIGLRLIFYEELFFEFSLRDLLDNSLDDSELNRIIKIGYEQAF